MISRLCVIAKAPTTPSKEKLASSSSRYKEAADALAYDLSRCRFVRRVLAAEQRRQSLGEDEGHDPTGAGESSDLVLHGADQARVFVGLAERQIERFDRPDAGGEGDDEHREHQPHAEDRNQDTPGQKAPPPDLVPMPQDASIDDGVIERQRCLQHGEQEDDQAACQPPNQ